jgi:hypothetical protein
LESTSAARRFQQEKIVRHTEGDIQATQEQLVQRNIDPARVPNHVLTIKVPFP